jgi:predicted phage terminase large subunit-like protein
MALEGIVILPIGNRWVDMEKFLAVLQEHPEAWATILRTPRYSPHDPKENPKQALFLSLNGKEAFYGGAAGGGKSDALLMAALQWVDVPGYSALLLRRSYAQLALPGALMSRSHDWLAPTEAKWVGYDHKWVFPSGSSVVFGYLENDLDVQRYQSSEWQFIGFDELTQFTEYQYQYMFSRVRKPSDDKDPLSKIPLRVRGASNPGNEGHAWVKERFITHGLTHGRPFIPATLEDNRFLNREAYEEFLETLDPITRARLRHGDWEIEDAGAIAKRSWFSIVAHVPASSERHRHWDFAATEKKLASQDPDYTAGVLLAKDQNGKFYVEHVVRGRWGPGEVDNTVLQTAAMDGREVSITFEQEPGSAGKRMNWDMVRRMPGYNVRSVPTTGSKVSNAQPWLRQAEHGNFFLKQGSWNKEWLDEVCAFPVVPHDDQVDGTSGAFAALSVPRKVQYVESIYR